MSDDIPTPRAEINRKAVETLEALHQRRNNREITDAQLETACEAIFGCTSGFLDDDVMDLLTCVRHDAKPNETVRRLFMNISGMLFSVECIGSVVRAKGGPQPDGSWATVKELAHDGTFPKKAAWDKFEKLTAGMLANGYRELS